ncbi:hypothetical protein [Streptacidiphilus sp. PAMC 29251]
MAAQHAEMPTSPHIQPIGHTIREIGDALVGERRQAFLEEVIGAEPDAVVEVMSRWWFEVMLDQVPGRDERLRDALAGSAPVELPDLISGEGE